MTVRTRSRLSAAIAAGALLVGACGGPDLSGPPGTGGTQEAQLRITALVVGTPIDLMVARVTASDIAVPLVFNLPVTEGVATGTLRIPPGEARTITLEAFDELGDVTHEGSATLDVRPGANPPVNIAMLPRGGDIPVTATLAEFSVIITPASAAVAEGATVQFTAQILDPNDNPLAGNVVWAVTNPAFARIDATGLASGMAPGMLSVVATFGGVAGLAQLEVRDGETGTIFGTLRDDHDFHYSGIPVQLGGLSTTTDDLGDFTFAAVAPGTYSLTIGVVPEGCQAPAPQEVQVEAGAVIGVEIVMDCLAPSGMFGLVTVNGFPQQDFVVTASQGGTVVNTATTDQEGFYAMLLNPGTYTVSVNTACALNGSQVTIAPEEAVELNFSCP